EALQKAARSLETGKAGFVSLVDRVDYRVLAGKKDDGRDLAHDAPPSQKPRPTLPPPTGDERAHALAKVIGRPTADRLFYVGDALRAGISPQKVHELTHIDPWFIAQFMRIVEHEQRITESELTRELMQESKRMGFSDAQIASLKGLSEQQVRELRRELGLSAVYGRVDTCAAEFPALTPYLYSSYESESESNVTQRRKVIILGGGPNRIGQGIEFDYCCCHAVFALRELGIETIMVNCNPETVSTDYDTSDRLYFEPLTLEDVLAICEEEQRKGEVLGVIVQFGGQTPLKLAVPLEKRGIKLLGTPADAIDRAEDRERFDALLSKLG